MRPLVASRPISAPPAPGHRLGVGPYARIGVFRALQLGDMLCAVPALRALRRALPHANVTLIGLPWAGEFARRFAHYIDNFIGFPGGHGLPERAASAEESARFHEQVRAARFDAVLQLHGSGEQSNALVRDLGAPVCAGFYPRGTTPPGGRRFVPYPEHGTEPQRLLQLLGHLGIPSAGEALEFPITDAEWRAAVKLHAAFGLRSGDYVGVHPGARAPARRWPAYRFAAVADAIAARGLPIVLTGTAQETAVVDETARAMRHAPVNLAGRTSAGELAAILAGARLLICNDTGVSHVAAAIGTPSVVIYTGSSPERWAPANRQRHRALFHCVDGQLRADGVSVEQVVNEAGTLLQ